MSGHSAPFPRLQGLAGRTGLVRVPEPETDLREQHELRRSGDRRPSSTSRRCRRGKRRSDKAIFSKRRRLPPSRLCDHPLAAQRHRRRGGSCVGKEVERGPYGGRSHLSESADAGRRTSLDGLAGARGGPEEDLVDPWLATKAMSAQIPASSNPHQNVVRAAEAIGTHADNSQGPDTQLPGVR